MDTFGALYPTFHDGDLLFEMTKVHESCHLDSKEVPWTRPTAKHNTIALVCGYLRDIQRMFLLRIPTDLTHFIIQYLNMYCIVSSFLDSSNYYYYNQGTFQVEFVCVIRSRFNKFR